MTFKTLKEVKDAIREENRELRYCLKNDLKDEQEGIGENGSLTQTGKYHLKSQYENKIEINKFFLKMLSGVRRLK